MRRPSTDPFTPATRIAGTRFEHRRHAAICSARARDRSLRPDDVRLGEQRVFDLSDHDPAGVSAAGRFAGRSGRDRLRLLDRHLDIDRGGAFATGALPRTLDAALLFDATLASGKSLSVYWDVQHSPDNSTWSDFATEASQVVATGQSGGGRAIGVSRLTLSSADDPNIASATNIPGQTPTPSINLGSAARYIRLNVVPHLASTGTDTGVIAAVGVFAGFDILQAPSS